MSERRHDREWVARILHDANTGRITPSANDPIQYRAMAEAVLDSDWLSGHDTEVRGIERDRIATFIGRFSKGAAAAIRFISSRGLTEADITRAHEIVELMKAEGAAYTQVQATTAAEEATDATT